MNELVLIPHELALNGIRVKTAVFLRSPLGTVQSGRPKLTTFGDFYKAVSSPYTPPPTKICMRASGQYTADGRHSSLRRAPLQRRDLEYLNTFLSIEYTRYLQ